MQQLVRIMGIDPGLANTGWGIIEVAGSKKKCLAYGCITTSTKDSLSCRLRQIYDELVAVIERYHPTELGIESIFFSANVKSAIATSHARGAALVAVASQGLDVGEYTPLQIKQTVVGNGVAEKEQVIYMVRAILGLDHDPKPDHAADALGAAVCHAHLRNSIARKYEAQLAEEAEQLENNANQIAADSPAQVLAAAQLACGKQAKRQKKNNAKATAADLEKLGFSQRASAGSHKRLAGWE